LDADLGVANRERDSEIKYIETKNNLEIKKARKAAELEIEKVSRTITALGPKTLVEISKAGPEMKSKLLQSLNLKGFLITDGKNPINLFNTANGMVGNFGMPNQQWEILKSTKSKLNWAILLTGNH